MMGFHHSARTEIQNDLFQRKIGEALELKSTDKIRVSALLIINQQPLLKNVAIYRLIVNNNPGNSPVFIVTYFHHAVVAKQSAMSWFYTLPLFTCFLSGISSSS